MHEVFIEGGLIRKLVFVETDAIYRDHLFQGSTLQNCQIRIGGDSRRHDSMLCLYVGRSDRIDMERLRR